MKLSYEMWNPSQGDFNKKNLARESYHRKKMEKKQKRIKIGLIALYLSILLSALYYYL